MSTVNEILAALYTYAPCEAAMDGDNIGLLVGRGNAEVSRVLVALDASLAVIDEAVSKQAQLLVVHHPVTRGLKNISDNSYDSRRLLALAENRIACITLHTNLDAAPNGVNDVLAARCGLRDTTVLDVETGLGRMGTVDGNYTAEAFAAMVSKALGCKALRYCDGGRPVRRVAVGSGNSTDDYELAVASGCDTFVTGDVRYHMWLEALESGINLIDAGHYETEALICPSLQAFLRQQFPGMDVSIGTAMRLPYDVLSSYAT